MVHVISSHLLLCCRSSDKTVKVWDGSTRECCHTFKEHSDQVRLR